MKSIVYIDMDNVLVDFQSGINQISENQYKEYCERLDEVPGIFSLMQPMKGAIDAIHQLSKIYDIYILSTAPWLNPSAWKDKLEWIQKHFGKDQNSILYKRLIISHHKNLNKGDYLIDDRTKNGAAMFAGEHIHFGTKEYPDWDAVLRYLIPQKL